MRNWLAMAALYLVALTGAIPSLAQTPAPPETGPVLVNVSGRAGTDLSGPWNWSVDP